jgi:UDP-N-acetylmuramate--alanine ligase
LEIPVSYSIGSNISFAPSSAYETGSEWFVYECDEFDRNFLSFHPDISLITSLDYDHPDTYETEEDYNNAFKQFSSQSLTTFCWQDIYSLVNDNQSVRLGNNSLVELIKLPGLHNRQNGALALDSLLLALGENYHQEELIKLVSQFPGAQRRFEKLTPSVYSDYAHHPAEIQATIQLAKELFDSLVVVYQPHQNVRQHLVKEEYKSCFTGAEKVYWLPTYLSREDLKLELLSSSTLTSYVTTTQVELSELSSELTVALLEELKNGKTILFMGAGSVDDWARDFVEKNKLS